MARDVGDAIGEALGRVAREAAQSISSNAKKTSNGRFSGPTGLAAGAGLAALAPLAVKGAGKLVRGGSDGAGPVKKARAKARDAVTGTVKGAVDKKVDDVGGVGGVVKEAGKSMLPGSGGKDGGGGSSGATEGVPKGRRMPIQQSIDVAVPLPEAYNAWTQFEEWPQFMHRLDRVSQEDNAHVSFKTKIWGISREFEAEIVEQRPDDRIKWRVTQGVTHTGVVSFHELSDRLTRVDVDISVHPGSLIEKAARGMRHVKRAVRADLARFKAHVEIDDEETGEWRGVIEDGDVKSSKRSSGEGKGSSSGRARASSARSGSRAASSRGGERSSGGSGRKRSSSGGSSGGRSSSGGSGRGRSSSGGSGRGRSSSGGSSSNGGGGSSANRSRAASNGRSGSGSSRRAKASSRS